MNYKEVEEGVIALAKDKGLLTNTTPTLQVSVTVDQVNKLMEALDFQERGVKTYTNLEGQMVGTNEEIRNTLGNIFITLVIQARLQHLSLEECLQDTERNYEGSTIL